MGYDYYIIVLFAYHSIKRVTYTCSDFPSGFRVAENPMI